MKIIRLLKSLLLCMALFSVITSFSMAEAGSASTLESTIKHQPSIHLSPEEKAYLAQKKEIRVCDFADWMPYVGHDGDAVFGILVDHYKVFESRIGIPMRFVFGSGTAGCAQKVKDGGADVVSSIGSPNTFSYLTPSAEIGQDFVALVTQLNTPFIKDMSTLKGKAVGVIGHYKNMIAYLHKTYPGLIF